MIWNRYNGPNGLHLLAKKYIELPYIYYPGYETRFDGMILEEFETENGFLGVKLYKDDGHLSVNYKGTKYTKISIVISLLSLIVFIVYVYYIEKEKEKNVKANSSNSRET